MQFSHSDRQLAMVAVDYLVVVASFLGALRVRFGPDFVDTWSGFLGLPHPGLFSAAIGGGFIAVFWAVGAYRTERFWSLVTEMRTLLGAIVASALILMSVLYFFRFEDVSRLTLAGFLIATAVGVLGSRAGMRRVAFSPANATRILFAGTDGAGRIMEKLKRLPGGPATVVGFVGRETSDSDIGKRLGDLVDLPGVLASEIVDEVIVCLPVEEWGRLDAIAGVCEEQGKVMRLPVDVVSFSLRKGRIEDLDSVPLLSLVSTPSGHIALVVKRTIDLVVSGVLLTMLLPFHLVLSVALRLTQGSPVFYRQLRGGVNGRPFEVLKYRTMVLTADDEKEELSGLNERIGPAFKITDDPRVTRLGRWLRVTSVDELPQLWNVFRGHMSLVGPRPQPLSEVAAYDAWHRRRLTVKPGITGLWQVTSRDDPSFDRWVDLDLQYIDSWSLWLDLKILARTPKALIDTPGS